MGPIQTLDDLLDLLRRRWVLILLVAAIGIAATLAYALSRPRAFEATAVIQFESPRVSEAEARDGTGVTAAQRLQLIEQRLMSRENLLDVIGRFGLFEDLPQLSATEKVVLLRSSTRLQTVAAPQVGFGGTPQPSALLITVTLDSPEAAAAVANHFAAAVLEENARREGERARANLAFFGTEEARIGRELAELEAEIAAFKNSNAARLPEAQATRREELARLAEARRELQRRLLELREERDRLAGSNASRAVVQRQIAAIDGQIGVLEEQDARLAARAQEIEAEVRATPEVERVLATYDRRRAQLQGQYEVVTRRLAEAEMAARLIASREAGRLELLEPALVPERPVSSGRRRIAALGAAASLALALALALLLDIVHPVLRSADQLERALGIRAVAVIPAIATPAELRRRGALRLLLLAIPAAGLIVMLAVGAAGLP